MDLLRQYGMDIIGTQENRIYHYHIGNRQFEFAELKLLVASIQAEKFLTTNKSNKIKHFRVDKMLKIDFINEKCEEKQDFKDFDIVVYAKKMRDILLQM